ncbi:MAG: 1-deoxy-D-xylulose-5-phosphate reductoisomerase [Thiobacillaceae bacterium]
MRVSRKLTILGATGTIGVNTLDVVSRHPERFEVVALTGATQVARLYEQCVLHRPKLAVMGNEQAAADLRSRLRQSGLSIEVRAGPRALIDAATLPDVDTVMAAIVGAAGLPPTLAAAKAGKRILLANKETLVVAGRLFMDAVRAHRAELLPIDSEHNAIFQALPRDFSGDFAAAGIKRIWLTASGGPFRCKSPEEMARVTPEQAVAHPNWVMGKKISVDSASMMNKGLEVIEAYWLFNARPDQIEVLVHPQSVIHSMVEYLDGSLIAQLGTPDMRTPIAYALGFPERIAAGVKPLDLLGKGLSFERPDYVRFPCLKLAFDALQTGGSAPAVLNAANEVAVEHFLTHRCRFSDIPRAISHALEKLDLGEIGDLESLLEKDRAAREQTARFLESMKVVHAC